jgi:hypothetical protein
VARGASDRICAETGARSAVERQAFALREPDLNGRVMRLPRRLQATLGWIAILTSLAIYLTYAKTGGTSDVYLWLDWMRTIRTLGPVQGFAAINADYPPLTSLILAVVDGAALATSTEPFIALKAALLIFSIIATVIVSIPSRRIFLGAIMLVSLVPSASALVYLDVLSLPPLLGGMWSSHAHRPWTAGALLSIAALTKWQPAIVVPFFMLWVVADSTPPGRAWWRATGSFIAGVASVVVPTLLIFGILPTVKAFERAASHGSLSNQALNVGWLMSVTGFSSPSTLVMKALSLLAYSVVLGLYLFRCRQRQHPTRYALLGYLAYAMLCAGAHENHFFTAMVLGILLASELGALALYWAIAANLNLVFFYGMSGISITAPEPWLANLRFGLATANCLVAAVLFFLTWRAGSNSPANQDVAGWSMGTFKH